jgi:hypothetical protein
VRREGVGPLTVRAASIAVAGALAFGLAGFYNLPLRDYARYSIRGGGEGGGVGLAYATGWSLAPYELPSIVVPGWTGFGGGTYWGGMPFTDYPNAYLGIAAVLIALPAFLADGAPRLFALALGVLALMISFGKHFPLYEFLYRHLPLFNKFRIPIMVVILLQLSAALATAWGWTAILTGPPAKEPKSRALDRILIVAASALALAFVIGVMGQGAWRDGYVHMAVTVKNSGVPVEQQTFNEQAAIAAYQGFVTDLGRTCLIGLLVLAVAWFTRRRKLNALPATALALALLLFDLWPVSGKVMKPVIGSPIEHSLDYGRDDAIQFLENVAPPGSFRVFAPDDYQSNTYSGFGIATLGGYHAAKTQLYQDFRDHGMIDNVAMLRLLNVRYMVLRDSFQKPPDFVREVFHGSRFVYENILALPRATVVGSYRVVKPPIAILDSLNELAMSLDGLRLIGTRTYLEKDPHLVLGPIAGAVANITSYGLNEVTVHARTPGPALLRISDLWYPDWVATVDGRPAEILKADYLVRAVAMPAGTHEVVFRYRSPAVQAGLRLSIGSLIVILGLFAWAWLRRRRAPAMSATPVKGEAA